MIPEPTRDDVAPPQYLPCPACGASTFTRADVKKHDAWHEDERQRGKRTDALLSRLEEFLDAVEGEGTDALRFPDWIAAVDEALAELRSAPAPAAGPLVLTAGDWAAAAADPLPDADEPYDPSDFPPQPSAADEAEDDDGVPQPWGARR